MTTEVKIHIKPHMTLPDVFDWLQVEQGLQHIVDWRWSRPLAGAQLRGDNRYIFQFEKEEHAAMFSLKWL
jgi:hypothetical protein